ncbi:MAG: YHS domain-containing (seleno)protein [Planctomycetota bacterium]
MPANLSRRSFLAVTAAAVVLTGVGLSTPAFAQPAADQPIRNAGEYHLPKKDNLAIKGYDPVAYFPEFGGKATKGKSSIEATHRGVRYRFANTKNRDAFLANPVRYEPAYGGWCAWAMKDGDKTKIDPKTFIVRDNRLFLFYNGFLGNTRSSWVKEDHAAQARQSDASWKRLSGEEPRRAAG